VTLDSSVVAKVDLKSVSSFKSLLPEKLRELSRIGAQGRILKALGLSEWLAIKEVQDIVSKERGEIYLHRMVMTSRHLSEISKTYEVCIIGEIQHFQ
jgi:hypothetical protein